MRKLVIAALLLVLAIIGCKQQKKTSAATPKSAILAERVEGTSPWKIALALDPPQPANQKPETFRFTITGADGKPAAGLDVNVGLVMPLMDMGKNEFFAKEIAPGVYQGSGSFTMDEEWEVFVTVTKGGQKSAHVFNVRVSD
jgi:uncharacterized lipoprotein NlpE involved in copper resistance